MRQPSNLAEELEKRKDLARRLSHDPVFNKLMEEAAENYINNKMKLLLRVEGKEEIDVLRAEIRGAQEVIHYLRRRVYNST